MDTASTPYRVHQCCKCPGDTEYYCVSCPCDLCPHCKESHAKDLKTIDHIVMTWHEKFNYISREDICAIHPNIIYRRYCELCQVPACNDCHNHKKHKRINIRTAYKTKRQEHERIIHAIRSEALFYRPILLTRIKADVKTFHTEFSNNTSKMLRKAQNLKFLIDFVLDDSNFNVFFDLDSKHSCSNQNIEMRIHIASLQRYVQRYEQSAISSLQFLSFIKTARLPEILFPVHASELSMTEPFNSENVVQSLSEIQITEKGNRCVGNEYLLKLMPIPELDQSLTVTGILHCSHISCVTSDRVWASDRENNIIMTNTKGLSLHHVDDLYYDFQSYSDYYGLHTLGSDDELIYLDLSFSINKMSKDMKTKTNLIENPDSTWIPLSLHCSKSTGDLLVAMYRKEPQTSKVVRYNQSGKMMQTIQHDNAGLDLYKLPNYITENSNGDIVVSDFDYPCGAVVVTESKGRHRFSYTGHPPETGLEPGGICTDKLSHILVCDKGTDTLQMIENNGQFLCHLLRKPSAAFKPCSLSYDINTHLLWVGSHDDNKLVVLRYIKRQDGLTESLSEIPTNQREESQLRNECQLMSSPELITFSPVRGVRYCYHISCVTPDLIWVSNEESDLILTNTKGVILHRVNDLYCHSNEELGLHTVNSGNELIYINKHLNINKLSKDMKKTSKFIERADSTWEPRCVYSSPFSGDLLVAMYREKTKHGKVVRYNQSGQLTQTIEHNNTGLELYSRPRYVTENNNGDIVVSNSNFRSGAVVVTERDGRHRFSYTGHLQGPGKKFIEDDYLLYIMGHYQLGAKLDPYGICTDALSNILVCDGKTSTIHLLERDGQFLLYLQMRPAGIFMPKSLGYDVHTHRVWVACTLTKEMCILRYIDQSDGLRDESTNFPDGAYSISRPAWEWGELGFWQTCLRYFEEEEMIQCYLLSEEKEEEEEEEEVLTVSTITDGKSK